MEVRKMEHEENEFGFADKVLEKVMPAEINTDEKIKQMLG